MGERPVVGEEERAGRVRVQAPHGHDALRDADELDDRPPAVRVARSRDHARRLVQEHVGERLELERPAVELDLVSGLDERRQAGDLPVHADAPRTDQLLGAPAGRNTRSGEIGIESHGPIVPSPKQA